MKSASTSGPGVEGGPLEDLKYSLFILIMFTTNLLENLLENPLENFPLDDLEDLEDLEDLKDLEDLPS